MIAEAVSALFDWGPRNATIENPSFSLNDPAAFEELFGGTETDAGVKMSPEIALSLAPVWQAAATISGDVATTTLNNYRQDKDGSREVDWEHEAQYLVAVQPNEEMSAFEFWRRIMVHALLWEGGYGYIERQGGSSKGRMTALVNLLPDRTKPARLKDGTLYYVTEVDGQLYPLRADQIIHVKGLSIDTSLGCKLAHYARNSWALALAAEGFESKFFKNGTQTGGVLEIPATFTEKAKQKLEEGFDKKTAGKDNWFKTVILRDGAKFHATTIDAQKSQTHELREDQVRDVARFFNLPASKLSVPGSVSYNSAEQAQIVYLTGCLKHWFSSIEGECDIKLLRDDERRSRRNYFEHNYTKLMETDSKAMAEVLNILIGAEIINPNEARSKLNMNRRTDPDGDKYQNPSTKPAPGEAGGKPEDGKGDPAVDPAADTNVQATALNGAQIASLLAIAQGLAGEQLPKEGTRAMLQASFPSTDIKLIDAMVEDLDKFTPKEPPAPAAPPASDNPPPPKKKTDKKPPASDAVRDIFCRDVDRAARRICSEVRSLAAKPNKFADWLDSKAAEHRTVFYDFVLPAVRVIDDDNARSITMGLDGQFFCVLLDSMSPLIEPPFSANELPANVDTRCKEFESSIVGTLAAIVLPKEPTDET